MGWFSASTATLIVAYLIYAVAVRLAARQMEPKQTGEADIIGDSTSSIERVMPSITEEQNASSTAVRSSNPPRLKPPTISAPPRPGNGFMRPPLSAAASLRVPQTKVLSNTHMQPASSTLGVAKKRSKQVSLGPGYSPLDWAALTSKPNNGLRGKDAPAHLVRVTPSRLKKQTGRKGKDAWTVYQGRVYNITPYLPFHPGGAAELMKGAGRDAGALFMEVHPWVNWDGMLAECLVGILCDDRTGHAET
ncbi:hypothetical protein DV736_g1080, partial [Chaetothyriales sp. CBS 134916]